MNRTLTAAVMLAAVVLLSQAPGSAQRASVISIRATSDADVRGWRAYVEQAERSGALRVRAAEQDPSLPARTIERLEQLHQGVPIWGAGVVRDSQRGVVISLFGELSPELTLETDAALSAEAAQARFLGRAAADAVLLRDPELTILRLDSGDHRLAYTAVVSDESGVFRVFVDANSGSELLRYSEIQTQRAVGTGRGVLGDTKKISVLSQAGAFMTSDQHRPPVLTTYDMRANLARAINVLNGVAPLSAADLATDTDNDWTDPAVVDAHVHIGWTYDYFFKRFGRRGLDNRDRPIVVMTNAITQQGALTAPGNVIGSLVLNAFWCNECGPNRVGMMYFGNGIPPNFALASTGQNFSYFAGALDIAAHELTHAVTSSSSNLIYLNESGALNEAFSDIMGTAVEFFYHPEGSGLATADYEVGEDIVRGVRPGALNGGRSMSNPGLFGDPDHYSRRFRGLEDNGGVHINSGIANHAYFLAIEGGTNRTSGLSVQGVGRANREQMENVFYRAFVFLLPPNATFATARAATIQAARDLYGAGSAAERAVTQAWTAVGVL